MKLLGKAISGTCGARTYSVGGAGVTARQKVCPVNKNSLAQTRRRGLFAAAGAAFKSLTALQREELHARALAAAETDVFGKKITLSDYAFFLREWMRGIRPAPNDDPSITVLNALRGTTWIRIMPVAQLITCDAKTATTLPNIDDELSAAGNGFKAVGIKGTIYNGVSAAAPSPNNLVIQMATTVNEQVASLTYTDVLGRVYTFQLQQ